MMTSAQLVLTTAMPTPPAPTALAHSAVHATPVTLVMVSLAPMMMSVRLVLTTATLMQPAPTRLDLLTVCATPATLVMV